MSKIKEFKQITYKGKTLKFKEPIIAKVDYVEGAWVIENEELKLLAIFPSEVECENIFLNEIRSIWRDYALAKDEDLTDDAIEFKKKLLNMIEQKEK